MKFDPPTPVFPLIFAGRVATAAFTVALSLFAATTARADFTLAVQFGVTPFPGTTTPIATADVRAELHQSGVVFVARTTTGSAFRYALLQHRAGALTKLLNETGGFPGGGDISNLVLTSDGTLVYGIVSKAGSGATSTNDALIRLDTGIVTTVIANSDSLVDRGTLPSTSFRFPSAGAGRIAFAGYVGSFGHYLYRHQAGTSTLIAQESVTNQPGGTTKFDTLYSPFTSPDGLRVFFRGYNSAAATSPDHRNGLYVEQGGVIARVLDNTTDIPGSAVKFNPVLVEPDVKFSPDGAQVVIVAGSKAESQATGAERFGLYRYAAGSLTTLADNTTTVGPQNLANIGGNNSTVVANDGSVYFLAAAGNQFHLYRARAGAVELLLRGDADDLNSFSRLWLQGSNLYFSAFNASFQSVLARLPVAGGTPTVVLNPRTHPAFTAVNARSLDRLSFSGTQVMVQSGQSIFYAPVSDLDGTGGGGTPPVPPAITTPPVATAAVLGRSATLSVTATGTGLTYQWRKDGALLTGATAATYTLASVLSTSAGNYSVTVSNSAGAAPATTPVALTLVTAEKAGRLINLSVLTDIATPGSDFTLGYVVGGATTSGAKPLVIRAGGPSLSAFGITAFLDDPKLETFAGSTSTGSNDNWGGSNQLSAALVAVGAFAFNSPTSKDAAVSTNINTRDNSVLVSSANNGTGAVIAEVYDATSSTAFAVSTPRLLNVSVRKNLGTGVTAGFVLGGSTPTRVLIRVVGPGLAAFSVPGTVVDPQLTLFAGSTKIGENNDWAGTAELTAAFASVGAFALPSATSKDAALLVSLAPGQYSVLATGVNNTTGVALVEVYEVP